MLPWDTRRFLARFELLLSETELTEFQLQFASGNFNVDNPPFQSWLVLKRATLPAAETQAAEQVCAALHYTALHCTSLHCTALHCTTVHCTALHCTALKCT